jgi:HEAT repeat protein
MNKGRLEDRLKELRKLRTAPSQPETAAALCRALRDRSNLIVAEAARIIGDLHLSGLVPELLEAFSHLFEDPAKKDSKCWGKTAIVKALTEMDHTDSAPFIRGSRHIQMEPVWGGQEDAAVHLRADCFLALVQCDDLGRDEIFRHLVDGMADVADPVRLEAVRAIAQMGGDEASLLLRLKARLGDSRSAVTGQVFDALLALDGEKAVNFVSEYLGSPKSDVRDEAALALGSSRLPVTVDRLIAAWKDASNQEFRSVLLRALSTSRQPPAIEFLLALVRSGTSRDATSALEALKLHEHSPEMQALIQQAQNERR